MQSLQGTSRTRVSSHADKPWLPMFGPPPREHAFEPLRAEGEIPASLSLTAYFNGPGHFDSFGRPYGHWFDGDGSIAAVRIANRRVEGAYRTTESTHRRIERAFGRPLFSAYGTKSAWPLTFLHPTRRIKSSANTAILCHDEAVYALMEGARPVRIEPHSLATLGPTDLGVPDMRNYSAHPVRLADGRILATGLRVGKDDLLDLYETKGGQTRRIAALPLAYPTMVHSFAATERHAVIMLTPICLRKLRFLFGVGSFADNLRWEPERGTEVIVVPLDAPDDAFRFFIEPFFFWHIGQTVAEPGWVHVDLVRYPDFANSAWLASMPRGAAEGSIEGGRLYRVSLDLERRRGTLAPRTDVLVEFPVASPRARGREATHLFAGHETTGRMSGMIDQLVRLDLRTGVSVPFDLGGPGRYPSEPQLVPRGADDADCWVLSLLYDAATHRSGLAIFDGLAPDRGPVAQAWYNHHVPSRFHGDYLRW